MAYNVPCHIQNIMFAIIGRNELRPYGIGIILVAEIAGININNGFR
jgi:hypothetical protein